MQEKVETIINLIRQSQAKLSRGWNCVHFWNFVPILFLHFKSGDKKLSPSWPHSSVRCSPPQAKQPVHVDSSRDQTNFSTRSSSQGQRCPSATWVASGSWTGTELIQSKSRKHAHHPGKPLSPHQRTVLDTRTECWWPQPSAQPKSHTVKPGYPDKETQSHPQASFPSGKHIPMSKQSHNHCITKPNSR